MKTPITRICIKLSFILLLSFCFNLESRGQTWVIENCTGVPSFFTSNLYGPMYSVSTLGATNRTACIYPSSSLGAIGGQILTNIFLHKVSTTSTPMGGSPNLKIYFKEIPISTFGSGSINWATEITGATLVYNDNPISIIGTTAGWKNFPLATNFTYTGNQNLAVFFEYKNITSSTSILWSYEGGVDCLIPGDDYSTKYSNVTTGVYPTTLTSSSKNRPYIGFNYNVVPCSNPVAGYLTTSKNNICSSENVTLILNGSSSGAGQQIEWYYSTDSSNWTYMPVVDYLKKTLLTNPLNVKTYFKAGIFCPGNALVYTPTLTINVRQKLNGTNYTINKFLPESSTNFKSLKSFINAISCGILGPVTVNVDSASGPFVGRYSIGNIPGSSIQNNIVINGNGATLIDTITSSQTSTRYLVELNGSNNITIQGFNIKLGSNSTQGYIVHLTNGASYNRIRNNTISGSVVNISENNIAVLCSGPVANTLSAAAFNYNTIENNTISGSYFGIVMLGISGSARGNIIRNNKVLDFQSNGIEIQSGDSTIISKNEIYRLNRTILTTINYGIIVSNNSKETLVEKNKIHDFFVDPLNTTTLIGIYINSNASPGKENIISNNIIYNIKNNGDNIGIYSATASYSKYYFNSISLENPSATSGMAVGFGNFSNNPGLNFLNNVIFIKKGGVGTKWGFQHNSTSGLTSNYNIVHIDQTVPGPKFFGNWGGNNIPTLDEWKLMGGANPQDVNSYILNPYFRNSQIGDLYLGNSFLNNNGTPIVGQTKDINDKTRGVIPDIGAVEYDNVPNEMGLISITTFNDRVVLGPQTIKVNFKNTGTNNIGSFQINWSVNNIVQPPVFYTGTLTPSTIDTIYVGKYNFNTGLNTVKIWSSIVNGVIDLQPKNDTIFKESILGLFGNYTVNPSQTASERNFTTLLSLCNSLNNYGIDSAVRVGISNGTYEEQISLNSIYSSNGLYNLTIESASKDSSMVIINKNSGGLSSNNYVLNINNINNLTFKHLTFKRSGNNDYSTIISLTGSNSQLEFSNNQFIGRQTISTKNTTGIQSCIYSAVPNYQNNVLIKNNVFLGNSTGLHFESTAASTLKSNGININHNLFKNFYTGISIANANAPKINYNTFIRSDSLSFIEYYGIKSFSISNDASYSNNNINCYFGTAGIILNQNISSSGQEVLVANNFITTKSLLSSKGISIEGSNNSINIFNNNILNESNGLSYALAIQNNRLSILETFNIKILNNNLICTNKGIPLYVQPICTTSVVKSNTNNFFTSGSILVDYGTPLGSLTAYQAISNKDSFSISTNPYYKSNTNLYASSPKINGLGAPILQVLTDIDGVVRDGVNPDIGANEFDIHPGDLSVNEFLSPTSLKNSCGSLNDSIAISIRNLSNAKISNFTVGIILNGAINNSLSLIYTDTLLAGQTDTILFRNVNTSITDTVSFVNIKSFVSSTNDSIKGNDTLHSTILVPPASKSLFVSDVEICKGDSVTLTTNNVNGKVYWYTTAIGGMAIDTGNHFTTPALFSNTTYFVELNTNEGKELNVGPINNSFGTGSGIAVNFSTMPFVVNKVISIDTISVYPQYSGYVTINIRDNPNNKVLFTKTIYYTINSSFSKLKIPLGFNLIPGNYTIDAVGSNSPLYRNNANTSYPYIDSSNSVSITGTGLGDYYYFFYDWKITSGNKTCPSLRLPVNITINKFNSTNLKSTPFNGNYNLGTLDSTDLVCAYDTISYKIKTPIGLNENDYGTTWEVQSPKINYLGGGVVSGNLIIQGNSWSYIPSILDKDSIVVFSARLKNLTLGCDSILKRYIKINSLPIVSLGNDTGICNGNTLNIHATSNSNKFIWSTGDTTSSINITSPGTYFVKAINTSGCFAIDSVLVSNYPSPNSAFNIDSVNKGKVYFNATLNPNLQYFWNFGDGGSSTLFNPQHTYASNGWFKISLRVVDIITKCETSTVDSVLIDLNSSIKLNQMDELSYKIYPNPISTQFTLEYELLENTKIKLELLDIIGRQIQVLLREDKQNAGKHYYKFDSSSLTSGIYFIRITTNNKINTFKIIK